YAEVVVASENSVHKLLELLPGKILNGEKVEVRLATRQNLSQFEAQARKREPCPILPACFGGAGRVSSPVPRPTEAEFQPGLCHWHSRAHVNLSPQLGAPLDGLGSVPHHPLSSLIFGHSKGFSSLSSAPSFPSSSSSVAVGTWVLSPRVLHTRTFPNPCADLGLSGAFNVFWGPRDLFAGDFSLFLVAFRSLLLGQTRVPHPFSCPPGDYSDAIETLLTAIAVIKQSRVASDERCRVLLSSLKDCLHGIEAKSYSTGSSSSRKRHRSRERSPSRSRESSRRHRDLLHGDDRHEDYFPERNREHERHRDRDRERDR
ncbi:CPSF7 factor, partial [Columbina picui]|nr:CPSF7 factor [Columbina picui]